MGDCSSNAVGKVLTDIRSVATTATAQDLQAKSHYAATVNLKSKERKFYAPPTFDAILATSKASSQESGTGQEPFIVHVGRKKVFASRSFVPFGACQKSIGKSLGISVRTVRRHLDAAGVERRQLMQSKGEYGRVVTAMKHETSYFQPADDLCVLSCGNVYELREQSRGAKKWHSGQFVTPDRFSYYYDKHWIYRCNLYQTSVTLTSMRKSRDIFNRKTKVSASETETQPPVNQFATDEAKPSRTPILRRRRKNRAAAEIEGVIKGCSPNRDK
ncbi:hypothetical protein H0X32_04185 [Patescibacteria group bacterium]|jgi:hypothetical protein|nr:hypothetical protein [Patescibacteria group bacterium]